jgi:hypothetical protein
MAWCTRPEVFASSRNAHQTERRRPVLRHGELIGASWSAIGLGRKRDEPELQAPRRRKAAYQHPELPGSGLSAASRSRILGFRLFAEGTGRSLSWVTGGLSRPVGRRVRLSPASSAALASVRGPTARGGPDHLGAPRPLCRSTWPAGCSLASACSAASMIRHTPECPLPGSALMSGCGAEQSLHQGLRRGWPQPKAVDRSRR